MSQSGIAEMNMFVDGTRQEITPAFINDSVSYTHLARLKMLQGALASQEEGLVHFKAQWEAIQPDLKKARQLDVQIHVGLEKIRNVPEKRLAEIGVKQRRATTR